MQKILLVTTIIISLLIGIFIIPISEAEDCSNFLTDEQKEWIEKNPDTLPNWMTPEEKLRIHEIGREFQGTSPPPSPVRQPAEFETMEGVLIRYPFGISYQIIAEMAEDVMVVTVVANNNEKNTVISQYQSHGVNLDNCDFLIATSDSYWTRDYGPWFIINGDEEQGVVDHIYNRPRPNDDQIPLKYGNWQGIPVYGMPLTHTGGNYMTDGQGIAVSTNLVWSENSGMTHAQIDDMVEAYLGITTYHVVPDALGEYIKHIDCWAKYLAPDIIMIIEVPQSHSQYDEIEDAVDYFESQTSCYGTPYKVERVYTHYSEPYINSLILNNKVLVPITGSQWDDEAIESYENALPGYDVLGFSGSWQATDALHCRTMGITDRNMLYIKHIPLLGNQVGHEGYEIEATIIPYSGENLISSSTGVYWKIEGGDWNFIEMQPTDNNDYQAIIPAQEDNTEVYYYIHAEDYSGRLENHPYIGAPMAYSFTAFMDNNPPEITNFDGPSSGDAGTEYSYCVEAIDPDGDDIFYIFDWGDGTNTGWIEEECAYHVWAQEGTYIIKVKAKDKYGAESAEETFEVIMPRNSNLPNNFIFQIIQKILKLFPIVENISKFLL